MKRARIRPTLSGFLYTHSEPIHDDTELVSTNVAAGVEIQGESISLTRCRVLQSTLRHATGLQVRASHLIMIDAANADLERSGWRDSEIVDARFTGARLNAAHVSRCTFSGCKMNLLQCQQATLNETRFEQCDLRGAYFNGSDLSGTVFVGSDLSGADFSGATIRGCDFRRATIEDIRVAPDQMQGVIVTSDQALYLARLFGLDIQE